MSSNEWVYWIAAWTSISSNLITGAVFYSSSGFLASAGLFAFAYAAFFFPSSSSFLSSFFIIKIPESFNIPIKSDFDSSRMSPLGIPFSVNIAPNKSKFYSKNPWFDKSSIEE